MTFDSNISNVVSLSKVLDAFIIEDEMPKVIVTFLQQHDDSFKDILEYSLHCNKLFQLDFFLQCNDIEQDYLLNKLKDISIDDAAFLTWQILKSSSGKAQSAKYRLRKEIQWILDNGPRHPYNNRHSPFIASLDEICFKSAETNAIDDIPLIVKNSKLSPYFSKLTYSLFQNRLLQYSFFANLDDMAKFMFLQEAFKLCSYKQLRRFSMQLLDSDEDIEVKICCFMLMQKTFNSTTCLDEKTLDEVRICKSFPELMLKMTIFNSDVSQYIVLYLLLFKRKWLNDWIEYDKDGMDLLLNVSELAAELDRRKIR